MYFSRSVKWLESIHGKKTRNGMTRATCFKFARLQDQRFFFGQRFWKPSKSARDFGTKTLSRMGSYFTIYTGISIEWILCLGFQDMLYIFIKIRWEVRHCYRHSLNFEIKEVFSRADKIQSKLKINLNFAMKVSSCLSIVVFLWHSVSSPILLITYWYINVSNTCKL